MIDAVEIFRKSMEQATAVRDKEIARLVLKAKTLEIGAASLRDCLMALLPPTVATDDMPNGGQPRTAKKRAAVQATDEQANAVLECLTSLGEPVTVKQLRGATKLGPKTLGAALRRLEAERLVRACPGRKWRLPYQPEAPNGTEG